MESIGAWLGRLGLDQYAQVFASNDIDVEVLPRLTEQDLTELGVSMGHRKKILAAAAGTIAAAVGSPAPSRSAGSGERRQLTVMFCDLVGSTALAERLDPEDLREVVGEYQRCASSVIERFGGHVAQLLGDGLLVYFGHPRAHEDDAERAVRAGLEIVAELGRQVALPSSVSDTRLHVRIGIHTGLIVIGDMGGGTRQETLALGETPNIAARLQGLAEPGTVVISDQTQRLVAGGVQLADLGVQAIKGLREPIRIWAVSGLSQTTNRFEAATRAGLSAFVGREEETEQLVECWNRAESGKGQVALITGEAGIGKSRILEEVRLRLGDAGARALQLQCSPYHQDSAYYPIAQLLARVLGFERDDPPAARLDRLDAVVMQALGRPAQDAALLASMLTIREDGRYGNLTLPALRQKRESVRSLADLLQAAAIRASTLVLFEDAHWSDPTSLEVLEELAERVSSMRVLLVVTCRPEFQAAWRHRPHVTTLSLTRLSSADSATLVSRVTGGMSLPPGLMGQIVDKADGVPLFVEELTKFLLESDQLRSGESAYEYSAPNRQATIPATLRDSLMARLDRVAQVKAIAQIGAVIGREFSYDVISAVAEFPAEALDRALAELIESGLAVQATSGHDAQYVFKHALVQEVAYESLLKGRRQELHRSIVRVLEARYPLLRETRPELFARHLSAAGMVEAAIPYWRKAADLSLSRMAVWEAASQLRQGLAQVVSLPPSVERDRVELPFHALLGTTHMLAKGWGATEVERAYGRAKELCKSVETVEETIWPLWGVWVFHHVRGKTSHAREIAEGVADAAIATGGREAQMVAHMMLGQSYSYSGQIEKSLEHFARSRSGYRANDDRALINLYSTDLQLAIDVHVAHLLWIQGCPDQAIDICRRNIEYARLLEHPYSLSWALTWGTIPLLWAGRVEEFLAHVDRGARIAEEFGFAYSAAIARMLRGWARASLGNLNGGVAEMHSGLDAFRATGANIAIPFFKSLLAEVLARAGHKTQGLELLEEAAAQVEEWGERWQEAELHRIRGLLLAAEPGADPVSAEASYRRGIDVAAKQHAHGWELRSSLDLARLLHRLNRDREARALVERALSAFVEGVETADVRHAREFLLTPRP